jgi:hypothetical protein
MTELGRPVPAGALAGRRQAPSAPVAESAGGGVALQFAAQFPELTAASSWWSTVAASLVDQLNVSHGRGPAPGRGGTAPRLWRPAMRTHAQSWDNLHHAHPTCARHRRRHGLFDVSVPIIAIFGRLGGVHEMRWAILRRLNRRQQSATGAVTPPGIERKMSSQPDEQAVERSRDGLQ